MTMNACASPIGLPIPQHPNLKPSCNPNSSELIAKEFLESLWQKPSCSGNAPTCSESSSADDEKTKLLKLLLAQMGTQPQGPTYGAQPCAA